MTLLFRHETHKPKKKNNMENYFMQFLDVLEVLLLSFFEIYFPFIVRVWSEDCL